MGGTRPGPARLFECGVRGCQSCGQCATGVVACVHATQGLGCGRSVRQGVHETGDAFAVGWGAVRETGDAFAGARRGVHETRDTFAGGKRPEFGCFVRAKVSAVSNVCG